MGQVTLQELEGLDFWESALRILKNDQTKQGRKSSPVTGVSTTKLPGGNPRSKLGLLLILGKQEVDAHIGLKR